MCGQPNTIHTLVKHVEDTYLFIFFYGFKARFTLRVGNVRKIARFHNMPRNALALGRRAGVPLDAVRCRTFFFNKGVKAVEGAMRADMGVYRKSAWQKLPSYA